MRNFDTLDTHARTLAAASVQWMDRLWDDGAGLLAVPAEELHRAGRAGEQWHLVRESVWYALGLLMRGGAEDVERAARAVTHVLANQWDTPDTPFHGTFRRAPQEPEPPAAPTVWKDYDPNWREFIGTTLAVILTEYENQLPPTLVAAIDVALKRAVVGTLARGVPATYTNIALMTAFLLDYCGARFTNAAWRAAADDLGAQVAHLFDVTGAFEEYNSPTYYGVDVYALALWRSYALTVSLREAGARIEAALWWDIARAYHAGLRNLCGPYDRSYGMDMRRYAALIGMWVWAAVGEERAPFPDWRQPFAHAHDFCFGPCVAIMGARIPADALPHFEAFQGARRVEQVIATEPRRVATGWVGPNLLLGAEDAGGSRTGKPQYHPATAHWRADAGEIGWLRLRHTAPADATATEDVLTITCAAQGIAHALVFEVFAPVAAPDAFAPSRWTLPGLAVRVRTNLPVPTATRQDDVWTITYPVAAGTAAEIVLECTAEG